MIFYVNYFTLHLNTASNFNFFYFFSVQNVFSFNFEIKFFSRLFISFSCLLFFIIIILGFRYYKILLIENKYWKFHLLYKIFILFSLFFSTLKKLMRNTYEWVVFYYKLYLKSCLFTCEATFITEKRTVLR